MGSRDADGGESLGDGQVVAGYEEVVLRRAGRTHSNHLIHPAGSPIHWTGYTGRPVPRQVPSGGEVSELFVEGAQGASAHGAGCGGAEGTQAG